MSLVSTDDMSDILAFNSALSENIGPLLSLDSLGIKFRNLQHILPASYVIWQLWINFLSTIFVGKFVPIPNNDVLEAINEGKPLANVSTFPPGFISYINLDSLSANDLLVLHSMLDLYKQVYQTTPIEVIDDNSSND
jgi:hypothetical protein